MYLMRIIYILMTIPGELKQVVPKVIKRISVSLNKTKHIQYSTGIEPRLLHTAFRTVPIENLNFFGVFVIDQKMSPIVLAFSLIASLTLVSSYQHDNLVRAYHRSPENLRSKQGYNNPSTFLYNVWNEIASSNEFSDLKVFASPKELILKLIRMLVSRLFFNLHSITVNFLLLL